MKKGVASAIAAGIASVKYGVDDTACGANAGRDRQESGKDTCPFPLALLRSEERAKAIICVFSPI